MARRVGRALYRLQRLYVFLRDEVVDRVAVAAGDRVRDHARRLGFGLRLALPRLGVAERRFAPSPGLQDRRLLQALGAQDLRLPVALSLQDRGAPVALRLHLPAHRVDQVARRSHVEDIRACDLVVPRRGGAVDHLPTLGLAWLSVRQWLL